MLVCIIRMLLLSVAERRQYHVDFRHGVAQGAVFYPFVSNLFHAASVPALHSLLYQGILPLP